MNISVAQLAGKLTKYLLWDFPPNWKWPPESQAIKINFILHFLHILILLIINIYVKLKKRYMEGRKLGALLGFLKLFNIFREVS